MTEIIKDLYQFTEVMQPMKLSMHQYLLMTNEPILIQTGAVSQAQSTFPKLKELLGERQIKYILISHFESDECGGLALVLKAYPEAVAVCSQTTAKQLRGFGITHNVLVKKPNELFAGNDFEFQAISYPAEMHLWEGLLFFEKKRGIFFSSDLMFVMGENHGQVIERSWDATVTSSGADALPNQELQQKMFDDLNAIKPVFVASGHGFCITITE